MKAIIQRVKSAKITVEGVDVASIGVGIMVLLGVCRGDDSETLKTMSHKLYNLRVFPDEKGKMSRSVHEVGGSILIVSNFTLCGDTSKGHRPSFINAEDPISAKAIYNELVQSLRNMGDTPIETGRFGAMMECTLTNDGPVTISIDVQ